MLSHIPVENIWGVGRATAGKLQAMNISTALQLRDSHAKSLSKRFNMLIERMIYELRGVSCLELEEVKSRHAIRASRSFGKKVTSCADLEEAISEYTARACRKLRAQHSKTLGISVFIRTNPFRPDETQHRESFYIPLPLPSQDTCQLIALAKQAAQKLYRPGFTYHKAGVVLHTLVPETYHAPDLLQQPTLEHQQQRQALMTMMDTIQQKMGKKSLFVLAQGIHQEWQMKSDRRSPRYTTSWEELPQAIS